MLGGAISATIIADNDHGHGPPDFSQSNSQFRRVYPASREWANRDQANPAPPVPEGGQSDQQGTQQD